MQQKSVALIDIDDTCSNAIARILRHLNRDKNFKIDNNLHTGQLVVLEGEIDRNASDTDAEVFKDPVIHGAPQTTQAINCYRPIIYLTSRYYSCVDGTVRWLKHWRFAPGRLIMKSIGDHRDSSKVKREQIEKIRWIDGFDISYAIDDDWSGKMAKEYRELEIPHYYSLKKFIRERVGDL